MRTKASLERSTIIEQCIKNDTEAPRGGAAVYALVAFGLLIAAWVIYCVSRWL